MTGEKDVVRLENENKELRQLLDDTLKAVSILNNVVERYKKLRIQRIQKFLKTMKM